MNNSNRCYSKQHRQDCSACLCSTIVAITTLHAGEPAARVMQQDIHNIYTFLIKKQSDTSTLKNIFIFGFKFNSNPTRININNVLHDMSPKLFLESNIYIKNLALQSKKS
jgi:hypothetical protein